MKKRSVSVYAVLFIIFAMLLAGCKEGSTGSPATPSPSPIPRKDYGPMITAETDAQKLYVPFWRQNIMYNESVTMIQRDDGSITGTTLFVPTKIVEIKDVYLDKVYTEGVDYEWTEGTNVLKWLEGSSIQYFTQNDIHGKNEDGSYVPQWGDTAAGWSQANPWDSKGRSRFGDAVYCVSAFLYEKQIAVTYEYNYGDWQGSATEYQGDALPKTMNKLKNKENLRIIFFGDSIFTGCDSSSMYGRAPGQPYFSAIVRDALREIYGYESIRMQNPSVGGMDSQWGVDKASSLVSKKTPDLVVIGFGMNDGAITAEESAAHVQEIIDTVKADNPDCEFIVVACMVPNKDAGFLQCQIDFPRTYKELACEGVAFIDMFSFHSYILETKDFIATSGNNINHPNDWLARAYAMNIMAALVEF